MVESFAGEFMIGLNVGFFGVTEARWVADFLTVPLDMVAGSASDTAFPATGATVCSRVLGSCVSGLGVTGRLSRRLWVFVEPMSCANSGRGLGLFSLPTTGVMTFSWPSM